ncbi:MAG: hypothetical protein HY000_24040 [Planctomycetes bacterium]|nr:hypothetical protein [Planctomycetota bacterium]
MAKVAKHLLAALVFLFGGWLLVVVVLLAFSGQLHTLLPVSPPHEFDQAFSTPYHLGVTMDGFLALQEGMSKSDVDWVLNGNPKLVNAIGPQTTYTWEDGSKLIGVVFHNDNLAGKWQSGL